MSNETMTDALALADSLDRIVECLYGNHTRKTLPDDTRGVLWRAADRLRGEAAQKTMPSEPNALQLQCLMSQGFDEQAAKQFWSKLWLWADEVQGEQQAVASPANCRNRLMAEGKPYAKSGCKHCKTGGLTGCPYERRVHDTRPQPVAVAGDAVRALRDLRHAYVRLLESGRDRIMDLGGSCDPVDVMERGDIDLRKADAAIAALSAAPAAPARIVLWSRGVSPHWYFVANKSERPDIEGVPVYETLDEIVRRGSPEAAPAPVAGDAVAKLPAFWRSLELHPKATPRGILIACLTDLEAALAQDRASQGAAAGEPEGWRLVPANDLQTLAGELQRLSAGVGAIADLADLARRLAAAAPSAPTQGAEREVGK